MRSKVLWNAFIWRIAMNNYELMKLAERFDEDVEGMAEFRDLEEAERFESESEAFKRKYKEFYTDVKLSHKEDW